MTDIYVLVRSLGRKCGMAEYAGFVAARLGGQLISSPKDLPEASGSPAIVLIQLEFGLYNGSLSEMINEVMAVEAKGHIAVGDYASEPTEANGWSQVLTNYCLMGPKYPEPNSFCLPLLRCDPLMEPDRGPPESIHLGTFGFAAPAKRHEEVIKLAIRLGVPATIISTVPNPWPGFEGSPIEQVPTSCLRLYQSLAEGHSNIKILHEEYYSTEEVHRILRGCSHLIGAMADMTANWGPSGSLRTMATVGRPFICTRSLRAQEVGAVIVETLDEVDISFLNQIKLPPDINQIGDGIAEYTELIQSLSKSVEEGSPIRRYSELHN